MRSSRTDLNGGEREQGHVISASEEGAPSQGQPKWWRAGGGPILPDGGQPDMS